MIYSLQRVGSPHLILYRREDSLTAAGPHIGRTHSPLAQQMDLPSGCFNIAMEYGSIGSMIYDGWPIKIVIFHGYVKKQRVITRF